MTHLGGADTYLLERATVTALHLHQASEKHTLSNEGCSLPQQETILPLFCRCHEMALDIVSEVPVLPEELLIRPGTAFGDIICTVSR